MLSYNHGVSHTPPKKTGKSKRGRRIAALGLAGLVLWGTTKLIDLAAPPSDNLERHLDNPVPEAEVPLEFIRQYQEDIASAANKYNIPPEVVAAVIIEHNEGRNKIDDIKDGIGRFALNLPGDFFDRNASLGPGQINVVTAYHMSRRYESLPKRINEITPLLGEPDENARYVSMYLKWLLRRDHRKPWGEPVLDDPHSVGIAATEYRIGPSGNPLDKARPNKHGLNTVRVMARTDWKDALGEYATITPAQQQGFRNYKRQKR